MSYKKNFLIISLQKYGGGAIDSLGISNGLCVNKFFHYIVISESNELSDHFKDNEFRKVFKIKTFKSSLVDFFVQTFIFFKFLKLLKILNQIKPEKIFITHFHPWSIFVFFFKFFKKTEIFYGVHDNPFDPKEEGPPLMLFLEKIFLKFSDIIITYSNFMKEDLKRFLTNKKIEVMYLGIHKDLFGDFKKTFDISKKELILLFFGRILLYKGLDVLLKAYEILKKKNLDIKLIIAGKGDIEKGILEEIKNLGVILKNYWLKNEELLELLKIADIIIVPYKKATQSGPISVALAYGVPVIASNVGSFKEFIIDGKNGFLFENGNFQELAEKTEFLYFHKEYLLNLSDNMLKIGEKFSWGNTVKTLISLVEK